MTTIEQKLQEDGRLLEACIYLARRKPERYKLKYYSTWEGMIIERRLWDEKEKVFLTDYLLEEHLCKRRERVA